MSPSGLVVETRPVQSLLYLSPNFRKRSLQATVLLARKLPANYWVSFWDSPSWVRERFSGVQAVYEKGVRDGTNAMADVGGYVVILSGHGIDLGAMLDVCRGLVVVRR